MPVEKMTVHLALSELKTLEARITKKLRESVPFALANKHSNNKINGEPKEAYIKAAKSAYDSVKDLCERRTALKKAVVMSNAVTAVQVCGVTYTVAEAIEMKNSGIPLKRMILNRLVSDYNVAKRECLMANGDNLERRADEHIKNIYGNTDMKNASDEVKLVRAAFIEQQTMEILEPLGNIKAEIERLEQEISDFETHVDAALSVSNAVTNIEIGSED